MTMLSASRSWVTVVPDGEPAVPGDRARCRGQTVAPASASRIEMARVVGLGRVGRPIDHVVARRDASDQS
jgi:hypothetical protein